MKRYSSTHDVRTELWGISGKIELIDSLKSVLII